jgi:hypothetical protein
MHRNGARWIHLLNFAVHVIVGTLLFLAVGFPALVLNIVTHQLSALGANPFTLAILTLLEHAILVFDGVAVLVYIGVSTCREVKDMLDE